MRSATRSRRSRRRPACRSGPRSGTRTEAATPGRRAGKPETSPDVPDLSPPFGRETIESIIPHRPPFLLVDEVLELEPGKRVRGRLLVPEDGWWFPGHFPERPVMPGVLTV